jgi:hypothetical protein
MESDTVTALKVRLKSWSSLCSHPARCVDGRRDSCCAILVIARSSKSETHMQVICSWCRGEGRVGFVGVKAPLDDRRETHSICIEHEKAVRARWTACPEGISSYRTPGESLKGQSSSLRRVVRSVVRFYVGLRRGTPKIHG